jgi:hypothetical protein
MADPNALWNFLRESPMPNRDYGLATEDATPEGRRRPRPIGGSLLQMPSSANALANVAGTPAPSDNGQPANALNPGVMTPFGWLPPDLASRLADYLTPARRDAADWLGAPVDGFSYILHRAGLNVPTTTPSSSTHTYQPAATVPFSSEFFNNLLGDAGNRSAEAWRRLRR